MANFKILKGEIIIDKTSRQEYPIYKYNSSCRSQYEAEFIVKNLSTFNKTKSLSYISHYISGIPYREYCDTYLIIKKI